MGARRATTATVLSATPWVLRPGAPGRDLPARFGPWSTAWTRFRCCSAADRERHRVERLINRLKARRRIATRYEKRAAHLLAMLTLAALRLWL